MIISIDTIIYKYLSHMYYKIMSYQYSKFKKSSLKLADKRFIEMRKYQNWALSAYLHYILVLYT